MARKSRQVYDFYRTYQTFFGGTPSQSGETRVKGLQVTDSSNHPVAKLIQEGKPLGRNARNFKRNMDLGGDFFTFKPYAKHVVSFSGSAKTGLRDFTGSIVAVDPPDYSDPLKIGLSPTERNLMVSKGTTAIKRVLPTNPLVDGVTTLAELRKDGIPKLPGMDLLRSQGRNQIKKSGGDYLNTQFALMPLVSEANALAKTVVNADKIIAQLYADSGKRVRRRYRFPLEQDIKTVTVTGSSAVPKPALPTQWYRDLAKSTKTTTTTTTRQFWFSGAFTYYLPNRDDLAKQSERLAFEARKLYGVRLTPDVAYNLTPWSWALDWVTNTGDVISNASAFQNDGLVMPYGYIMCETHVHVTVDITCPMYGIKQDRFITSYGYHSKARLRATPYGFGLTESAFTTRQWSILGALALTKAPGKLP